MTAVDRRSVLATAGAAFAGSAALVATTRMAAAEGEMEGHDHAKMMAEMAGGAPKHQALIDSASACIKTGTICAAHSIMMLGMGDTKLKECLNTVNAMLPMCDTLVKLAAVDATRLKDVAKVCADIVADCEKECRKHEKDHAQCKACAEACVKCLKDCKALIES